MAKLLLLLQTDDPDALQTALCARVEAVFGASPPVTLQLMREAPGDVFYDPQSPHPRPQLVLELVAAPGSALVDHAGQLAELLRDAPVRAESMALVMQERIFIDCDPQPVHFHYLMLKKPQMSVADYNDYYVNYHSRFGLHTPGIAGYRQNYVDHAASQAMARQLGLSCREVTSISELIMPSLQAFLASPAMAELGEPAAQDEARFMDRHNSVSFCSEVVLRLGDVQAVREAVFEQYFDG